MIFMEAKKRFSFPPVRYFSEKAISLQNVDRFIVRPFYPLMRVDLQRVTGILILLNQMIK